MVRALLEDWASLKVRLDRRVAALPVVLVCGVLIAPILAPMADELGRRLGVDVRVVPVPDRSFRETVTVSGLLPAADVLARLSDLGPLGHVCLPRAMFNAGGQLTLDDVSLEEIRLRLGCPVSLVERMSDVADTLRCGGKRLE